MDPTDNKLREINEIVSSPENRSKNSVSLLLEAASQVGESVIFNYLDEMGLSSRKLFTCEVKVGRLPKCRGSGNNKKLAKANAADQALELIKNRTSPQDDAPPVEKTVNPRKRFSDLELTTLDTVFVSSQGNPNRAVVGSTAKALKLSEKQVFPSHTSQTASPFHSPPDRFIQDSPKTAGLDSINPVGSLQEMCMKNSWTPPSYDVVNETGESHMKTFIYECKVESWIAQGRGQSKKSAKKLAAENILRMIKEGTKGSSDSGFRSSPSESHSRLLPRSPYRNFPANKWSKIPISAKPDPDSSTSRRTSLPAVPFLLNSLYDEMESEDDDLIVEDTSHGNPRSVIVIEDIISEEFKLLLKDKSKTLGFTVGYEDMREKGYSGKQMCFVRLGAIPPLVCCGSGHTTAHAHENAAQSALNYLNSVWSLNSS